MSEECTHDCSTCGSSCEHVDAKDLIAPLNKDSSIKHVYAIMSGKGGVGKSFTTASLATAMAAAMDQGAMETMEHNYLEPVADAILAHEQG